MNTKATICVLIPHYNGLEDLYTSLKSIKEDIQVDVLVIDDGSRVAPDEAYLDSIYNFGNMKLEVLAENQGIEHALNTGLKIIINQGYEFIGRLDCGDLNHPNKYRKQLKYLEDNPEVMLLGTWVRILDESHNYLYDLKHPTSYKEIKRGMRLNSTFVHPTVVIRATIVNQVGLYPTQYSAAEDYAFYFKIIEKFKAENLPELLLDYVNDPNSISAQKRRTQVKNRIKIMKAHYNLSFYATYGILRSCLLYLLPRNLLTQVKKVVYNQKHKS